MLLSFENYISEIRRSMEDIESDVETVIETIVTSIESDRRLWIVGNGGSLAIAQHFAQDLLKMAGVRAHVVNCPSVLTAYSNDDGFEYSLFNPINILSDEGDVVIIFSCSGKSRNYVEFVSGFEEKRNRIISIVGTDGGFLKEKSDACIHIKSDDYQVCETAFCIVCDVILKSVMNWREENERE